MNKIIRYWNQNRSKIILVIAIIAFIILFIQLTNVLMKNMTSNAQKSGTTSKVQDVTKPTESYITGETLPEATVIQNSDLIKEFVEYCNNNQIQQAYNLLTDDCKAEFNNDINKFEQNYISQIFNSKKIYSLELFLTSSNLYTYKITYTNGNLLATGGVTGTTYTDYITIVNQNNENKLNISNFINKKIINKNAIVENIEIIVNSKKAYKDYEEYNITIKNTSQNPITYANSQNSKDICLIDQNETTYSSFINEIPENMLTLINGQQITFNIKFNKIYDVYRIIEKMKFSNISINNEKQIEVSIDI